LPNRNEDEDIDISGVGKACGNGVCGEDGGFEAAMMAAEKVWVTKSRKSEGVGKKQGEPGVIICGSKGEKHEI
jgi:hypothetical protein